MIYLIFSLKSAPKQCNDLQVCAGVLVLRTDQSETAAWWSAVVNLVKKHGLMDVFFANELSLPRKRQRLTVIEG